MGFPTSEVGYTSAKTGRGDHEVHEGHVVALGRGENIYVYIAPTCFNANASSSGSSYSLPAKLHKRVNAVLVVFLKEDITFVI
jgi:hypothetical protein